MNVRFMVDQYGLVHEIVQLFYTRCDAGKSPGSDGHSLTVTIRDVPTCLRCIGTRRLWHR